MDFGFKLEDWAFAKRLLEDFCFDRGVDFEALRPAVFGGDSRFEVLDKVSALAEAGVPVRIALKEMDEEGDVLVKEEVRFLSELSGSFLEKPLKDNEFLSIEVGGDGCWQVVLDTRRHGLAVPALPRAGLFSINPSGVWCDTPFSSEIPDTEGMIERAEAAGSLFGGRILVPADEEDARLLKEGLALMVASQALREAADALVGGVRSLANGSSGTRVNVSTLLPNALDAALRVAGINTSSESFNGMHLAGCQLAFCALSYGEVGGTVETEVLQGAERLVPDEDFVISTSLEFARGIRLFREQEKRCA